MSYDIELINKKTNNPLSLKHSRVISQGTAPARYSKESNMLVPDASETAEINITFNYSPYYYDATENDERFKNIRNDGKVIYGIKGLFGKTARESIPMIKDMIRRIEKKYKNEKGFWIVSNRLNRVHYSKDGDKISNDEYMNILLGKNNEIKKRRCNNKK